MRIAGLDPGKQKDSFAFVGTVVGFEKIKVVSAKRWLGRAYLEVEKEVARIHSVKPFDHYVVERNNTGEHVIEVLQHNYRLPVLPVFTYATQIRDAKKKFSAKIMDKIEMTRYMLILFNEKKLVFPERQSKEMRELVRQLSIFAEHKSVMTGNVRYQAEGAEHDDLVMALMLAVFIGRYYIDKRGPSKRFHTGTPKSFRPTEADIWGSGVPEEYTVMARETYMPS